MRYIRGILGCVVLCGWAAAAQAAVMDVGLWHLGEADQGATAGAPADLHTVDSVGTDNLTLGGTGATYTNLAAPRSTLAISFPGTAGYSGTVESTVSENWGIEIWANPASYANNGNRAVIYNGSTSTNGYGIYEIGSNWDLLFGGSRLQAVAPVTLNQWTDLALVDDNGLTSFYVNGRQTFTVSANPVAPGSGTAASNLLIAENNSGTERYSGLLDEGRVFTFAPGQFTTADLNAVPEPATFALAGMSLIALGLLRRRGKRQRAGTK